MRYLARRRRLAAVLVVVTAAAAGGIAYASIPDSGGAIHACYSPNGANGTNGTQLNIVDPARASCSKGQREITWSQTGPPGAAGNDGVSVTSAPLAPGDSNCPGGGSAFTAAGPTTTYACNGAKGDKGDTGPAGPSAAYSNYGDGLHSIAEGNTQTVASLTLPAGSYTLSAGVSVARTTDDHAHAFCSFTVPGADTFNQQGALASLEGVVQLRLPIIGDFTSTLDPTVVFLRCNAIDGSIDAFGDVIATRVGSITPSE